MVDINLDGPLYSLDEIPNQLPTVNGRRIHKHTPYRWASRGVAGVILDTVQVGGIRCTSETALQRFFAEVDKARAARRKQPVPVRSAAAYSRAAERAGEQLAKMGV